MHIYDISMELGSNMLVYPGNPRFSMKRVQSIPNQENNISLIAMGSHTGTHVDAPSHIRNGARGADSLPLDSLYGSARVLDLTGAGSSIGERELSGFGIRKGEIILIKSSNSNRQYKRFRRDYAHVSIDGARYLASRKIRTLCVDYLSVKRAVGDDMVHDVIIDSMTLFEGVMLKGIKPGRYTFAGLPLRMDCDGSPARALLIKR